MFNLNSERDLANEMIFTAALSRTLWPKLVALITFMCGDLTYLMLRCVFGATLVAVAYDDLDL